VEAVRIQRDAQDPQVPAVPVPLGVQVARRDVRSLAGAVLEQESLPAQRVVRLRGAADEHIRPGGILLRPHPGCGLAGRQGHILDLNAGLALEGLDQRIEGRFIEGGIDPNLLGDGSRSAGGAGEVQQKERREERPDAVLRQPGPRPDTITHGKHRMANHRDSDVPHSGGQIGKNTPSRREVSRAQGYPLPAWPCPPGDETSDKASVHPKTNDQPESVLSRGEASSSSPACQ